MNALNTRMGRDLLELWTRLTEYPEDLRCVVLAGTGERAFFAGGDLKERNGMTDDQWRRQHEVFERQHWTLADLPLPVIAAVNGHAYGGGFEMVLPCDFVYAARHARFALPEVGLVSALADDVAALRALALDTARTIAGNAPLSVRQAK
jgi:enoyl-CoA hydratase/carnithine racemase